jgi:hypothetical protein
VAWSELFIVVAAILLSTIPYGLRYYYDVKVSEFIRTSIVLFTICALVLGEIHTFYDIFPWWDIFLHVFAGAGLAILMYSWLHQLTKHRQLKASPIFHTIFVFAATTTVLVIWEIYEFSIDILQWSDNKMQPSLTDTMTDLIVGLVGGLAICMYGYTALHKQKKNLVTDAVEANE